MASKQQQRKQQRIVVQRVDVLEQRMDDMPTTIMQFLIKHNEFSTIFNSIIHVVFELFKNIALLD